MPNWACGEVSVKGTPLDVESFCKLFIFYKDKDKERFFARSFTWTSWDGFIKSHREEIDGGEVCFFVDFAWSAHSCLINGYPDGVKRITLMDACKEYNVDVVINTQEPGHGFEEHITCNPKGELVDECENMPVFKCSKCGKEQVLPKDLSDDYCNTCEDIGEWEVK